MTVSIDETSPRAPKKVTITETICKKSKRKQKNRLKASGGEKTPLEQSHQQIELKQMLEVPKTGGESCAINISESTEKHQQNTSVKQNTSPPHVSKSKVVNNNRPPADGDGEDDEPKRSRRLRLFDFFCTKRIKPKSIKMPEINIQRGPVIAIVISLLVSSLILWYIISGDGIESDDDNDLKNKFTSGNTKKGGNRYLNPRYNRTKAALDEASTVGDAKHVEDPSKLAFVLITTLLIVIAIVVFVFVGSLVHYYKKPNPFMRTRSQSIVSSIFSHHNHHNFLYYLDKDDDEVGGNDAKLKAKCKKEKTNSLKSRTSTECRTPTGPPPIIVVNGMN